MKKQDDTHDKKIDETNEHVEVDADEETTRLTQEVEEWKGKYLRALADYQNLERRMRDEKDEVRRNAAELILGRMLPFADTLKKVTEHVEYMGLTLALKELHAVLQEQGVERMNVIGKPFDPHEMECIEVVEGKDGVVIEEALPGYMFRGKVLRVAQVKVGKKTN
jgi:molecular chaperone GrpE